MVGTSYSNKSVNVFRQRASQFLVGINTKSCKVSTPPNWSNLLKLPFSQSELQERRPQCRHPCRYNTSRLVSKRESIPVTDNFIPYLFHIFTSHGVLCPSQRISPWSIWIRSRIQFSLRVAYFPNSFYKLIAALTHTRVFQQCSSSSLQQCQRCRVQKWSDRSEFRRSHWFYLRTSHYRQDPSWIRRNFKIETTNLCSRSRKFAP